MYAFRHQSSTLTKARDHPTPAGTCCLPWASPSRIMDPRLALTQVQERKRGLRLWVLSILSLWIVRRRKPCKWYTLILVLHYLGLCLTMIVYHFISQTRERLREQSIIPKNLTYFKVGGKEWGPWISTMYIVYHVHSVCIFENVFSWKLLQGTCYKQYIVSLFRLFLFCC